MKIFFLLIIPVFLLGCDAHTQQENQIANNASYLDIQTWTERDTIHNKIFLFFDPFCPGCSYMYDNYYKEALEIIDTSRWTVYYIITTPEKIRQKLGIEKHLNKMNIFPNNLYYWNHKLWYNTHSRVAALFKTIHPVKVKTTVPKAFIVDRKGYLAIIKTFPPAKVQNSDYYYDTRDIDTNILKEDDFSVEYKGFVTIN